MLVGVVMNKGENGLVFGERLDAFLRKTRAELPLGMELVQITNQADAIKAAVNLFQVKFLVAVIVVMGIGFLALGLRAGLIVGVAVPITLGLTFVAMKAADVNLDRITLGALIIALGLLVDDAIIAIEMMLVKLEEGWSKVSAATHAWNAAASPMLFGTLVTMFGFVPIGFAKSGVGEYAGNIFGFWLFRSLSVGWWPLPSPLFGRKIFACTQAESRQPYGRSLQIIPGIRASTGFDYVVRSPSANRGLYYLCNVGIRHRGHGGAGGKTVFPRLRSARNID